MSCSVPSAFPIRDSKGLTPTRGDGLRNPEYKTPNNVVIGECKKFQDAKYIKTKVTSGSKCSLQCQYQQDEDKSTFLNGLVTENLDDISNRTSTMRAATEDEVNRIVGVADNRISIAVSAAHDRASSFGTVAQTEAPVICTDGLPAPFPQEAAKG